MVVAGAAMGGWCFVLIFLVGVDKCGKKHSIFPIKESLCFLSQKQRKGLWQWWNGFQDGWWLVCYLFIYFLVVVAMGGGGSNDYTNK